METKEVVTKILDNSNKTQILRDSGETQILDRSDNNTLIADLSGYVPVELSSGSSIDGYTVNRVIKENTGEATILLVEKDSIEYVMKVYHKGKQHNKELVGVINSIDCPYLLHTIDTGKWGEREYEILPYFRNGDLLDNMPLTESFIESTLIPNINTALHVLHDNNIVHRDVKPNNIFISDDRKSVVLGDFGICSVMKSDASVRATSMSRTLGYAAPETASGFVSKESDYYSLGITILHLCTGQDPFEGMSEMQILYQTITKSIEIPSSISNSLSHLIKGLTLKDRSYRWSYAQVSSWLNKENVEIREPMVSRHGLTPYKFGTSNYYTSEDLSLALAKDWENAKKHIYRGLMEKGLLRFSEELSSRCMDLKSYSDQDKAVFELIYLLNPGAPLCFRGVLYNDIAAVGDIMAEKLPNIDGDIMSLLTSGCFEDFLRRNDFDIQLREYISLCIHKINNGEKEFYFAIMYALSGKNGYSLRNYSFGNIDELVEYLQSLPSGEMKRLVPFLMDDEKFPMWLHSQGFTEQVEDWKKIYIGAKW